MKKRNKTGIIVNIQLKVYGIESTELPILAPPLQNRIFTNKLNREINEQLILGQ